MREYNSLLLTDFYKATHMLQYKENITHLTSYLTPRSSRLASSGITKVVLFGLTPFCIKYLEGFQKDFFEVSEVVIRQQYNEVLGNGLGYSQDLIDKTLEKILALHELGYLPIEINALPEGTLIPMGVPAIEIRTTHPQFAWVGQAIESLLSCSIWHPMVSATIAHKYAEIANTAYMVTCDKDYRTSMCDFSMRGQESLESAIAASAAWLTSFYNSSTVPARDYIERFYTTDEEIKIGGLTSTEHSVMCSDAALNDGDERETIRRFLTDTYKNVSFSVVCDSYDFWNIMTNVIPSLKDEIEAHNGFLGIRDDSAEDIVDAICGYQKYEFIAPDYMVADLDDDTVAGIIYDEINEIAWDFEEKEQKIIVELTCSDGVYSEVVKLTPNMSRERGGMTDNNYYFCDGFTIELLGAVDAEAKGMVETLYDYFGGTTNEKGYIEINPKVKAVYGDSITIPRALCIYSRLKDKGFAANNVSLGVGSFSFQSIETGDGLAPFTRDTFSIAIKATYGRYLNDEGKEEELFIFKSPKGFSGKKSQKGLCHVFYDENGKLTYVDELNEVQKKECADGSAYCNYFKNGLAKPQNFNKIRERLVING